MTKAAIVVGSAPCLYEDVKRAQALYPDATVVTVNGACVALPEVDVVVAGHTAKAEKFTAARLAVYPDKPFEVWANWTTRPGKVPPPTEQYPCVTRWFGSEVSTGATSAAKAARMCLASGFDVVILCGCPLDSSGYFEGESQKGVSIGHDCRRVGDPEQDAHRTILNYRDKFRRLSEGEFKGKVFSMSGLTRKFLGSPPIPRDGTVSNVELRREQEIKRYDEAYKNPNYRMGNKRRRHAREVLERLPAGSLLDVGAGRGEGLELARQTGHTPVMGVEPVEALCQKNVIVGVATYLPFDDAYFDTVMCLDVLEHLIEEDIEPALHEMYRVAKKHVFLTASERPHVVRGLGDMHISKRPAEEWRAMFEKVFEGAEIEPLGMIGVSPGWLIWI